MSQHPLIDLYENTSVEQPRAALFHDLSGFGKCSLTVALPILSAAGIEASCIPTAVLSTHTGGFEGFTFRDLTEDLPAFLKHWEDLGLNFDAVYSGYLGSPKQADILLDFVDKTEGNPSFYVDPVMADNGSLYPGFDQSMVEAMKKVAARADYLLPNMTEAAFLLDEDYQPGPYTEEYVRDVAKRLSELGPRAIILTGIGFDDHTTGAYIYDREKDESAYVPSDLLPGMFHGTGDVFSSYVLSGIMNGLSLENAVKIAVDLTSHAIAKTIVMKKPTREGVEFEHTLRDLADRIDALKD